MILLSLQLNVKKSVVQGYLWKVNNYADGQEIMFLKNQIVYYHVHAHSGAFTFYFSNINFHYSLWFPKWSLPLRSSNQNFPCTSHSLWAHAACPTGLIYSRHLPNLSCSSFYGAYHFDLCFCFHVLELYNVS